jgi:hypothetical protein
MPSTSITGMAARTTALAEKIILAKGGRKLTEGGVTYYEVNPAATFTPPLEAPALPHLFIEKGKPFSLALYGGGKTPAWTLENGGLPTGLTLSPDGKLAGTPAARGEFSATVTASENGKAASTQIAFTVEGANMAKTAARILGPEPQNNARLDLLRDGVTYEGANVSSPAAETRLETFGYTWTKPVTADTIAVTMGRMDENAGWFDSLSAEYKTANGDWAAIPGVSMTPEPVLDNDKHLHPHYITYVIRFPALKAQGLRVKGLNGGEGDNRYVSLSEIAIYGPDAGK